MYRKKNREKQEEEVKISLEALVPEKHILRASKEVKVTKPIRQGLWIYNVKVDTKKDVY